MIGVRDMSEEKGWLPAYLEVAPDKWAPLDAVLKDPALADQAAAMAMKELERWRSRYDDFFDMLDRPDLHALLGQMNDIRKLMGADWPTLADEVEEAPGEEMPPALELHARRMNDALRTARHDADADANPDFRCKEDFDLRGSYMLDEDRRVGRVSCRLGHAEEALAYLTLAREWPPLALRRLRAEIEALRPHWGPGVTKEQAVAAFLAAREKASSA
jgi:hypothetical protein